MCTLSGLDKSYLQSVYNYYNSTGLLCPNATDSRCVVTPELDILVKDTLHLPVSDIYRQEGEAQLDLDLQTSAQGYAQTLLADAIFIKIHQGLLTTHHQNLIRGLLEKSPNNLYYQLIGLLANNGDWPSFEQRVLTCLKKTNGGGNQWMFDSAEDCLQPAYGQDIVSLAQWVINSGVVK
jgi:hypothetical protein